MLPSRSPLTLAIAASVLGITLARPSAAQSCLGQPSLATTARTISTGAAAAGADRLSTVRYGIASTRFFGGAQFGFEGTSFSDPRGLSLAGDVGYALSLGKSGSTQLCPTARFRYEEPFRGSAYNAGEKASQLGLSLGHAFIRSSGFAVVPFVSSAALIRHDRLNVVYGELSPYTYTIGAGQLTKVQGKSLGLAGIGAGVRFNDRFTVTPSMTVPFGASDYGGDREAVYSLGLTWAFKRSR